MTISTISIIHIPVKPVPFPAREKRKREKLILLKKKPLKEKRNIKSKNLFFFSALLRGNTQARNGNFRRARIKKDTRF